MLNKNLGSLVATDMTRCINCTAACASPEIAGEMELGQAFRGEHAEIMPFIEKTVDSELSRQHHRPLPGGRADLQAFRFSARTWEMSRRKSVSPHDSLAPTSSSRSSTTPSNGCCRSRTRRSTNAGCPTRTVSPTRP